MFERNSKVAVIGSTNWDICMYLESLPKPGETIGNGVLKTNLGGKGANQAIAAHLAGAETTFISCIGDDRASSEILYQFDELGLNKQGITQISDSPTGTACIFIDAEGENCIGLTPAANAALKPGLLEHKLPLLVKSGVLIMQLETPLETVISAARAGKKHQQLVILNPAPAQLLPDELFAQVDLLTPNRGELTTLTGMPTGSEQEVIIAARQLIEKGVTWVIVTLGADGAMLISATESRLFPALQVEAVDTTAAGDCFNGYLAANLAKNGLDEMGQAIQTAIAASAFAVSREGAIPSLPRALEVETLLQSNSISAT